IVVPRIAALLAARAKVEFSFLLVARPRIEMCRSEQHFIAARAKETARGFADAGRDTPCVSRFQIQNVNLVEGIVGLTLALENQRFAVRRKISFTTALAFKRELPRVREKCLLAL